MLSDAELSEISLLLSQARKVVITTHRSPDADAMGSSLGMMHLLREIINAEIHVVVPDPYPEFLSWMPGSNEALAYTVEDQNCKKMLIEADLIFCLDFNHPSRTDAMEGILNSSSAVKIMIDHHQEPDHFARYRWSDTSASSTCEMIIWFMDAMGWQESLNKIISTCLYTGIMTDTGSFRFSSASSKTHKTISRLMEFGIEHWKIHEAIFNQNTLNKLRLWGFAFLNKLVVLPQYKTAYISLSESELEQYKYQDGDLEGIVNYALSLKGVVFGVLFSEKKNKIRISFRSIGAFSVNNFSRSHFNGGGHENAAGGVSERTLSETIEHFTKLLAQYPQLTGN